MASSEGSGRFELPGQHVYDGMVFSASSPVEILERVKRFNYRDSDVFIASYPKGQPGFKKLRTC